MIDVKNKRVTVVGLGTTAISLVRLLVRKGAIPFVSDASSRSAQQPLTEQLEELGVAYERGGHSPAAFAECEIIMPSPGVNPRLPLIQRAVEHGAKLISELDFAASHCTAPVLAVTGTNGKTTTTELIAEMVRECGHAVTLAGNNATPFAEVVLADAQPDYVVLEVSSYQLETSDTFRPHVGVVLNVTDDHLERHGDLDTYAAVKGKLFACQTSGDFAIVNADDRRCTALVENVAGQIRQFSMNGPVEQGVWFDGDDIKDETGVIATRSDVSLPGRHNLANALAAFAVVRAADFNLEKCKSASRKFAGVEHRLEEVLTLDGVRYVNDSKSTNLDSLRVALESYEQPIRLIAGGRGKGSDYRALLDTVVSHVKSIVAVGDDAPLLEDAFGSALPVVTADSMAEAVAKASDMARSGDVVLLSPGCASFDWYNNFEERGRAFKHEVHRLAHAGQSAVGE